jgi:hypothetical protein
VLLSAEICHDGSEDGVNFLRTLVNKQTLPDIMGCISLAILDAGRHGVGILAVHGEICCMWQRLIP